MTLFAEVLLYFTIGVIHWWWSTNLSFFGVAPNFIFVSALAAAVLARPAKALTWCFFLGIYQDLLGTNLFGDYALSYTLMAYGVYLIKKRLDMISPFSQIVAAMSLTVMVALFYQTVGLVLFKINPVQLKSFLAEPFLNALIAPVVFYIFSRLQRKVGLF